MMEQTTQAQAGKYERDIAYMRRQMARFRAKMQETRRAMKEMERSEDVIMF